MSILIPLQLYFIDHCYSNFTIFQHSSYHFFHKVNLYALYPGEYDDYFLYNPSFALLFSVYAYWPTLVGMILFTATGCWVYFKGVSRLPLDRKAVVFIFYYSAFELITSFQNLQTNPLIAGSILLSFSYLERKKTTAASFFINLGFFVKAYGAISGALLLLIRPVWRNLLLATLWFVVFLCLPLVYYSPYETLIMYRQWYEVLSADHDINFGLSLMSFSRDVLGYRGPSAYIQAAGVLLLLTTFVWAALRKTFERDKYLLLSYLLIWVVIFNHSSESPTYIIATTGVAIWYVNSSRTLYDKFLVVFTFIFTVLSPTDIFPRFLREEFIKPYSIKALGPSMVFFYIQFLLFKRYVRPGHRNTGL